MPQRLLTLSDLENPADPAQAPGATVTSGPSSGPAAPMPTLGPSASAAPYKPTGKLLTLSDLEKDPGGSDDSFGSQALGIGSDLLQGVGASAMSIPVGGYNLLRKGIPSLPPMPQMLEDSTRPPDTTAGHIGEFAGDVGTFALPGGLEEKILGKLGATSALGKAAAKAVVSGTSAGAVEAVKSGGDPTQTAVAAATAGGASGVTEALASPMKSLIAQYLGRATGMGKAAVETQASLLTQSAADAYKRGLTDPVAEKTIVQDFTDALRQVRDNRNDSYRQAFKQIDPNIRLNPQSVMSELRQQMANYSMIGSAGKRAFAGSPITSATDQKTMLTAVGDVNGWKDFSPDGLDRLKQRLTSYADEVSLNAKPFFYRIADAAKRELNSNVPGYQALTKDYADVSKLIDEAQSELSTGKNVGTAIRKLQYALSQNNEYRRILMEALDSAAGTNLKETVAGYSARQVWPRGLQGVLAASPAAVIGSAAAALHSPVSALGVAAAGAASSPRLVGQTMALISLLRRSAPGALNGSYAAVAPAVANQILPRDLPPPPANLAPPPDR